ncbi:GNAT family N-acetyltransferase [Starkeya sp. ORNL1]|uniref:GNAT family N-acetyltransferase n=1 Tax=Starkeya sp. ORNL1 TaxID=2709380 RepID=UPI001462C0D8|nr:GNAT family N-acetyltransferase [Starkeya sp. ORNL1]QJP16213.1 GNAT family N-acetyltransferase [Starkeya sp. ORNL1]
MAEPVTTTWLTGEQLADRAGEWRALAENAVEPNVFAGPECFIPALRHLDGERTSFLVAECDGGLAGILPLRFSRARWGVPLACAIHQLPYAPHGTPLIARSNATSIVTALLDALLKHRLSPTSLLLQHMPAAGPLAEAWEEALAASGRTALRFAPFERPAMRKNGTDYLAARMSKHRRRRLEQQRRKLHEHAGETRVTVAAEPAMILAGLERFFALEASGWKGRRGTAAGQEAARAAFFRENTMALAERGEARIVEIMRGAAPIAAALLFIAQDRAWFFKTAYDETLARYSPGVLLDVAVTEALDRDPRIALGDSLMVTADVGFQALWQDRLPMADWLVEVERGSSRRFALSARLEALRRGARASAKQAVAYVRTKRGLKA